MKPPLDRSGGGRKGVDPFIVPGVIDSLLSRDDRHMQIPNLTQHIYLLLSENIEPFESPLFSLRFVNPLIKFLGYFINLLCHT